jgi:hypothetical protein
MHAFLALVNYIKNHAQNQVLEIVNLLNCGSNETGLTSKAEETLGSSDHGDGNDCDHYQNDHHDRDDRTSSSFCKNNQDLRKEKKKAVFRYLPVLT